MTNKERIQGLLNELYADLEQKIKNKGAIDMIAGSGFVGYIGKDAPDKWWCDVWSWGSNHGKIYAESCEQVQEKAYSIYGV